MIRTLVLAALLAPTLALAQASPPAAPPGPPPAAPAPAGLAAVVADVDRAWATRDDPASLARMQARLQEAERIAPASYEVLWRVARLYFWLADDPKLDGSAKSKLGKTGWDYGDRATAANPGGVEGWHYAAAGVGNYGLGIGIFTALRQGIEGKFKDRLARAEQIDPGFDDGGIQIAWGRFWYELPWPKYSPRKAQQALDAALARNPNNVRARVYLAELHFKEDRREQGEAELRRAIAAAPGRYDAPEERRWQGVARELLARGGPAAPQGGG